MKFSKRQGDYAHARWALVAVYSLSALLWIMADAHAAPAEPKIVAIEFTGNKVTRRQILRQEMQIKEGDAADPVLIELSRQAIMDLGLFTSVRAYLEPRADGVLLRIAVKEKHFILPVPKLNRDDDNKFSFGAELSFDNLAGLNQKLKIRYETEESDEVPDEKIDTSLVSYSYPRVNGSAWTLGAEVSQTHAPVRDPVLGIALVHKRDAWTASVQASRWLVESGPSQGWQFGTGLVWRRNVFDSETPLQTDPLRDAQAVGLSGVAQFIDVRDFLFSRSGLEYGYNTELGAPVLGSDTHYTRHEFFYRKYIAFSDRLHENIDIQARLGLSSGDIFASDAYAYSLGGSKTLRGYKTGSFQGNSFVLINVQYLRPFFKYYPLRGALFLDVGNAYPSNTEIHLGKVKWDVGLGFRLRLKSFVKLDLRVDAAYAYDAGDGNGEWKYFAGTKEIF